jgi:hypothetical protein
MSVADNLPSVLYIPPAASGADRSLSVARVLKQAIELLEQCDYPAEAEESGDVDVIIGNLGILLSRVR